MEVVDDYKINLRRSCELFRTMYGETGPPQKDRIWLHDLYSRLLWGGFAEIPLFRDAILSVKKMGSEAFLKLLKRAIESTGDIEGLEEMMKEAVKLITTLQAEKDKDKPATPSTRNAPGGLVSEFDITNDSMRTTVKSGRVRLGEL